MERIRALVRPTLTWGFGAAFICAGFHDAEAAKLLSSPTFLMIGFYFNSRENKDKVET